MLSALRSLSLLLYRAIDPSQKQRLELESHRDYKRILRSSNFLVPKQKRHANQNDLNHLRNNTKNLFKLSH